MPRKIALSFLGTNDYIDCHYYLESTPAQISSPVKYMQEALVDLICTSGIDVFYVFVTEEARKANWEDNGHIDRASQTPKPNTGLKNRLLQRGIAVEAVPINPGFSEAEIWAIFESIIECIQTGDEVILDITHAFRSLPTLGTILIPYCRTMKSAQFSGIYYGAFEKLGMAQDVLGMPMDQRKAPIINLSSFVELMDWSTAADHIIRFGSLAAFADLAKNQNIIPEADQDVRVRGAGKGLAEALRTIEGAFYTVRGKEILEGKMFAKLETNLKLLQSQTLKTPYSALLTKVAQQFSTFTPNNLMNGLQAVAWCKDNRLTQQGLTLLREWACIYVLEYFGKDSSQQHLKEATSSMLSGYVGEQFSPNSKEKEPEKRQEEIDLVAELEQQKLVISMQKIYESIRVPRNDINHAGMNTMASSAPKLEEKLRSAYEEMLKVCANYPINEQ